jgi:nucleoside 2-deoxyribosyltransferase
MSNTANLFGLNWTLDPEPTAVDTDGLADDFVFLLHNKTVGRVALSMDVSKIPWKEEDDYKALSIIHEKSVTGFPYLICFENEKNKLSKWNSYKNTICTFNEFVADIPKNLLEIQRRTLMLFYTKYPHYGMEIREAPSCYACFSANTSEAIFILKSMARKEWLNIKINGSGDDAVISLPIIIDEEGWGEIEKNIRNDYSKKVFIAMAFKECLNDAHNAIKRAVEETGLVPVRIDKKEHLNWISGEIFNEIKYCHSVIADVTDQNNGVYFEAGFAMGNRKPVIWCCKESDKENIHFDTRQINHILWKDEQDLYERLKNRIEHTILL